MTTFIRDDKLAVQPEAGFGAKIETSGAYVGRFTLAKERIARTGTIGIEFSFEADDGQMARYLTLWVARASGEKIEYPYGLLSALMVCLDVDRVDTTPATVDEWDQSVGARVPTRVDAYAALMNKPIGIVLQREERVWEGKTYVSMKIVEFFAPEDRRTPAEILADTHAAQALGKLVANLREKIVRTDAPPVNAEGGPATGGVFIEDDIPF